MTIGQQIWVAPPFDGPRTGGTIYNERLVGALRAAGVRCDRIDVEAARLALPVADGATYWVDSLHLEELPDLARRSGAGGRVRLIVHYLPSLVRGGDVRSRSDLSDAERAAVDLAGGFLATSAWMASVLTKVGVPRASIVVVEPGAEMNADPRTDAVPRGADSAPLRALMIANAVPAKGIAPFLQELRPLLASNPPLELTIVGSTELDPRYGAICRDLAAGPPLRERVHFAGAVSHAAVAAFMGRSHVLVSASRMESFGMALLEARAAGLPILARLGGNVAAHVAASRGSSAFGDDASLAAALVRLATDRAELAERTRLARSAMVQRSWQEAAAEFARAL